MEIAIIKKLIFLRGTRNWFLDQTLQSINFLLVFFFYFYLRFEENIYKKYGDYIGNIF